MLQSFPDLAAALRPSFFLVVDLTESSQPFQINPRWARRAGRANQIISERKNELSENWQWFFETRFTVWVFATRRLVEPRDSQFCARRPFYPGNCQGLVWRSDPEPPHPGKKAGNGSTAKSADRRSGAFRCCRAARGPLRAQGRKVRFSRGRKNWNFS